MQKTVLVLLGLIVALNAQATILSVTQQFFAGYAPGQALSPACMQAAEEWQGLLESNKFGVNGFQDIANALLVLNAETAYFNDCEISAVAQTLAYAVGNFSQNDILELAFNFQSIAQDATALVDGLKNGTFNATAVGAILAELNKITTPLVEFRVLSEQSDIETIMTIYANASDLAYGVAMGLSATGYAPLCLNSTDLIKSDAINLAEDLEHVFSNPSDLEDLEPLYKAILSNSEQLSADCNIPQLESILGNLSTSQGSAEIMGNVFSHLGEITGDISSFKSATSDVERGQIIGNLIQMIIGFTL